MHFEPFERYTIDTGAASGAAKSRMAPAPRPMVQNVDL